MADRPETPGVRREDGGGAPPYTGTDGDLLLGRILGFAGGVAFLVAGAAVAAWLVFGAERRRLSAEDPPRSPIPEANEPVLPPEPRLQPDPPADMRSLHARETAILHTWGWADEQASTVRIPIERAIDLMAARKLRPALADAPTGEPPPDEGEK